MNRLRAAGAFPVVLVIAPAGYGKTTLVSQWAARDSRPFAWLSLDERDNDPVVLLRHVAAALDRVDPIGPAAAEPLRDPREPVWDHAVPRLARHLGSGGRPFVVALDDAHVLDSKESLAVVSTLIENIPPGSMIVLAGRSTPRLPVAALRVGGPLLEIGAYELALSRREAELLFRAAAVDFDEDEIATLVERTEGWAAGLYLAALAGMDEERRAGLTGDDRNLADYLHSEYLSALPPRLLEFLRRTSVLERMCPRLCNAVLERRDSAATLRSLEELNLFLVPLDGRREWFRYHRLFRQLLRRELEDHEPDLAATLHARAADWYEAQGDPESALVHADASGDCDRAARILGAIALEVRRTGRVAAIERWLACFDDEQLQRHPALAIHGSQIHALRGRPKEAERWLRAAERGASAQRKGIASVRAWIAVMRSAMCARGPKRMKTDAEAALARRSRNGSWRSSALLMEGTAALLLGDEDRADSILAEAVAEAEELGSAETRAVAVGERSLLAAARDDHREAELLAQEAFRLVEDHQLGDYATSALALAVSARTLLRRGHWDSARHQIAMAEELTPSLTYVLPWLAVQVRLELGHAYVTLRDRERALHMLDEAREILELKPRLGNLAAAAGELAHDVDAMPKAEGGSTSGLTAAELRLLPLLSTHLSFREIGERLYVSRNTIKTQAISVYRKLGVSSRSEAIERAAELGLVGLEDPPPGKRPSGELSAAS